MGGRRSQAKGRKAERELCEIFNQHGLDTKLGKPQSYGEEPDLFNLPGFHLEAKRCERLCIPAWIEQSERDAARFKDGVPTVIFRQNRQPWRVVLPLDAFIDLYRRAHQKPV